MRDFRDAKTMAQTLRESLTTRAINVSHSESLELVSKMLGVADWNTLSALLHTDIRDARVPVTKKQPGTVIYPAIPIRDLVPFPSATFPLFVGRPKTIHTLNHAFERQREVVLVVQRESGVDEPGFEDVYEIGVLAQLLELERLPDATLKVLVQAGRRVLICRFIRDADAFQAEIADVSEGPILDAPELIQKAIKRFETYAEAHEIRIPQTMPPLDQIHDPGRVADIISTYLFLPISDRQSLLTILDPVARLKRINALMDVAAPPFSPTFVVTRRRALDYANQRNHQYATLEHLLLALIDDADASAVLRDGDADLGALRGKLVSYLDNELKHLVIENGGDAKPTTAQQRVVQRAALHARDLGSPAATGANVLLAIIPEMRSPAARMLAEQRVSGERMASYISRDVRKEG